MHRLRVLAVVADLHFGGGESRILNIATAIDRTRFDYHVATLYAPNEQMCTRLGDMRAEFHKAGIPVTHLDLPRPLPAFHSRALQVANTTAVLARTVWRLRSLFEQLRPDVIDAHLQPTVLTAVPAAGLVNIPVALTLYQAEPLGLLQRSLARACIRHVAALVSDSHVCAHEIATSSGRGLRDLFVVPNAVRLPAPSQPRNGIFAALRLSPSTETVIAQIAGIVPTKGYETLLEAAARFLPNHPRAVLLCVGYAREGNGYVEFLRRRAAELGIADQVRIAPWPGSIADIWSIVDMHVHASDYDSLPNAIVEGMSLGRPAVVTSTGGITELVSHEESGLVVEPQKPAALADAISRLLNDPGIRRRLGRAAKRRFDARCAPEVTTPMVERMFQQIAVSRHQRPRVTQAAR